MKKLTSATELVKVANTHEIGLHLQTEISCRKAELEAVTEDKMNKKFKVRPNLIHKYVRSLQKKPEESSWTIPDLKVSVKAMKTDINRPLPNLKHKLVEVLENIKYHHDDIIHEHDALNDRMN